MPRISPAVRPLPLYKSVDLVKTLENLGMKYPQPTIPPEWMEFD